MHDFTHATLRAMRVTAVCLLNVLPLTAGAQNSKITSLGAFTDKAGVKHRWQINDAHALLWEGAAYLPVGGTFSPRSLDSDSDAAWADDKKALELLAARDIRDVIVWPARPLPDVSPAALQRVMDYLDANSFHYGLACGPGMTAPLTGTVVRPATYRYDSRDSLTAQWTVPNADAALYVLIDLSAKENKILRGGGVFIKDPQVSIPMELTGGSSHAVALLYPHKTLTPAGNGSLPDVWAGFDGWRDRLLTFLGKVKFSPNFRFFLDPLARQIGTSGECDYLIPDSTAFLTEFEAYLSRRYPSAAEMKTNWGLAEGDFKTHREMARLVPLWANDRGAPYFVDPASGKMFRIGDARQSHWWEDFLQFRRETLLYAMNAMANLLKRESADVPVVYTWTQTDPMFLNNTRDGGFDGLAVMTPPDDATLTGRILGPAYSEAEQASRTIWCVAAQVGAGANSNSRPIASQTKTTANSAGVSKSPYPSRNALFYDLDQIRRVGYKGFFADGLQAEAGRPNAADWTAAPESLDWLREYGTRVAGESAAATYAPRILLYPQMAPGPARTGFIPGVNGTLWLNAFVPGDAVDLWPSFRGYTIKENNQDRELVLTSLQGARRTHLFVGNPKAVTAHLPDGTPVPLKWGKNSVELMLDERPVVFELNGQHLFPMEAAEDTVLQLSALYQSGLSEKVPSVEQERASLERAQFALKQQDYETAYNYSRTALDELTFLAAPYIWLEGELPYREFNTFNEVAGNVEASNKQYLRLSTPNPPGRFGYGVRYVFDVPNDGRYDLWLAGTVPGPGTSPIKWRVNTDPEQDSASLTPQGPLYLNERFGWIRLGSAQLKRGPQQSLTIYVTDRAQNPPEFIFSIDSILLTQGSFAPNGTVRPLPVDAAALRQFNKTQKKSKQFGF